MRTIGIAVWLAMSVWAAAWLPLAYREKVLFPQQMMERFGTAKVIPAIADFFIWADIFWLPWILGYIVYKNGDQWNKGDVVVMGIVSFVLTYLFHRYAILTGEYPATLGWKESHTLVGYLHIPYMTVVLTIIGLYFLRSTPDTWTAVVVGLALLVQVGLDLHLPMKFIQAKYQFAWYPNILTEDPKQVWMLAGGSTLVVLFTLLKIFR